MATITARPFKLALVQLAGLGKDKAANLAVASAGVRRAVQEGKADIVVLPVSPPLLILFHLLADQSGP